MEEAPLQRERKIESMSVRENERGEENEREREKNE